jgi:uncharacterized protein
MAYPPLFPSFKPLEIDDREFIQSRLWAYQPTTSELTFTNLFIWRGHYRLSWCLADDCLVFLSDSPDGPCFLPPVGPAPRAGLCHRLLTWLKEARGSSDSRLERADARLREEVAAAGGFLAEAQRDHFDYVYSTLDLIGLVGGHYQPKRNHLNSFQREYRQHTYEPLTIGLLAACEDLAQKWCEFRRCEEDMGLMEEWQAVKETLAHFQDLALTGGAMLIEGRLEAFTVGEKLNDSTAVIHLEKANPEIRGLYAAINQAFLEHAWPDTPWVNREQDLGEQGLRKAKLSYHPHHLEEKFTLRLA